jgi:hypothetical protein
MLNALLGTHELMQYLEVLLQYRTAEALNLHLLQQRC